MEWGGAAAHQGARQSVEGTEGKVIPKWRRRRVVGIGNGRESVNQSRAWRLEACNRVGRDGCSSGSATIG